MGNMRKSVTIKEMLGDRSSGPFANHIHMLPTKTIEHHWTILFLYSYERTEIDGSSNLAALLTQKSQ